MRLKKPKVLFPTGKERRPRQDIPTEAARLKARMARAPRKGREGVDHGDIGAKPKSDA